MGIPRLKSHLQPFFEQRKLGCRGKCKQSYKSDPQRDLVFDGPGLVYAVYHNLLSQSRATSAVDALPSYELLANAVVSYLDQLLAYGVKLGNIYFDGHLPDSKIPTRLERLESHLRQLAGYHAKNSDGASVQRNTYSDLLMPSGSKISIGQFASVRNYTGSLPAIPFLIPAAIEGLTSSHLAKLVKLVPSEADVYCAQDSFENGSMVLTGDTDLLLYDLGAKGGTVTFFDQLHIVECLDCKDKALTAMVWSPPDVRSRLGINSVLNLAYEIYCDRTVTLSEACRRVRLGHEVSNDKSFAEFASEYDAEKEILKCEAACSESGREWNFSARIDPRLSELILQLLQSTPRSQCQLYLPFLIEDPTRASAWDVLRTTRGLAYSIAVTETGKQRPSTFYEYYRRGSTIYGNTISRMQKEEIREFTNQLTLCLSEIKNAFGLISKVQFWRVFALYSIVYWYLSTERSLPAGGPLSRAYQNSVVLEWQSWSDIHLIAQIDATLYSVRLLKQIIDYFEPQDSSFDELRTFLADLPSLAELMPPRFKLESEPLDLQKLKALVTSKFHQAEHDLGDEVNPATVEADIDCECKRRKRKRDLERSKNAESTKNARTLEDHSNIYNILSES